MSQPNGKRKERECSFIIPLLNLNHRQSSIDIGFCFEFVMALYLSNNPLNEKSIEFLKELKEKGVKVIY